MEIYLAGIIWEMIDVVSTMEGAEASCVRALQYDASLMNNGLKSPLRIKWLRCDCNN